MADPLSKMTDAQRRRETRKLDLRERIRGSAYVRVLEGIAAKANHLEPSVVPAYRLKADIYLRLLAKVLPDLRAVEHTLAPTSPEQLSDERLADIASGGGHGASKAANGKERPIGVH